jgi:hypothetical protein
MSIAFVRAPAGLGDRSGRAALTAIRGPNVEYPRLE